MTAGVGTAVKKTDTTSALVGLLCCRTQWRRKPATLKRREMEAWWGGAAIITKGLGRALCWGGDIRRGPFSCSRDVGLGGSRGHQALDCRCSDSDTLGPPSSHRPGQGPRDERYLSRPTHHTPPITTLSLTLWLCP